MSILTDDQRRFLETQRAGRFATCDATGQPHVLPVCYGVDGDTAYFSIDRKPKRGDPFSLKRLRNIRDNPRVALVVDHYEEDWQRLAWVMLQGSAQVMTEGTAYADAQRDLCRRYPQLGGMDIRGLPLVMISIDKVLDWTA